jgi:hypothetical protein
MPVTQNDLVAWVGTGRSTSPLPNMDGILQTYLAADGWQNIKIQRTGTGLIIQATAPRTWPTSTEIGNDFQTKARAAGWTITQWNISSAGAAWLAANNNVPSNLLPFVATPPAGAPPPQEKTIWDSLGLGKLTPSERTMAGVGVAGLLVLLLMPKN